MNTLKRIVSYSPYLLILLVVLPGFAFAQGIGEEINGGIKAVLWTFVNNVFGFLLGASGILLDFAVNNFVIGFGETWGINSVGVGGAIDDSWKLVRDLFNITFIFGLVWLGFKMILRSDDSNTRRTLITLILAALLVNFSLFITKFVVDFTNILAAQIADAFVNNPGDPAAISNSFMQLFGLSSSWDFNPLNNDTSELPAGDVSYSYIFGTAIVFMIGAFTFAAGGIMLIIRFAALCIYMVFSPLMFLGMVFPGLRSVSSKYWSGFLGRAFYAPAYLMLIYLAAFVMGSYNSTAASFGRVLTGDSTQSLGETIGPFVLTCVFLIASVVVAGKMSADGASTTMKLGNNIRGRAQRGLRRGVAQTGRMAAAPVRGAGTMASAGANRYVRRPLANSAGNKLNNYVDRKQKEDGRILGLKARGVWVDEKARGMATDLKASKGNLKYTADEEAKKRAAIGSRAEADSNLDKGLAEMNKPAAERDQAAIAKMQSAAGNLSQKRLQEMSDVEIAAITPYLKSGQYEKFLESDEVSSDKKGKVVAARKEAINEIIRDSSASLRENINKLSTKQIETMGAQWVEDNAHLLTKDQMDSVKKSDSFIEAQKGSIIGARKTNMVKVAGEDTAVATLITGQKPVEIAQYPVDVLTSDNIHKELKPDVLKQIIKKDSLTASEMLALRKKVEKTGLNETKEYLRSPEGIREWYNGREPGSSNTWSDPVV